jgi:hypothetical protein
VRLFVCLDVVKSFNDVFEQKAVALQVLEKYRDDLDVHFERFLKGLGRAHSILIDALEKVAVIPLATFSSPAAV